MVAYWNIEQAMLTLVVVLSRRRHSSTMAEVLPIAMVMEHMSLELLEVIACLLLAI
jgi:hypothetical protein